MVLVLLFSLFTWVLEEKNIQKAARSKTCSFRVPGLQGKTKRVKPIVQLATITDGPSVYSDHLFSASPSLKKIWLFESSSASLLVRVVAKERGKLLQAKGLPLLPLGAALS